MKKQKSTLKKAKAAKPKRSMAKLHKGIKEHLKDDIKMYKKEAKEDKKLIKKLKK